MTTDDQAAWKDRILTREQINRRDRLQNVGKTVNPRVKQLAPHLTDDELLRAMGEGSRIAPTSYEYQCKPDDRKSVLVPDGNSVKLWLYWPTTGKCELMG